MKIFIQNMVSLRCKLSVRAELEKLGLAFASIELGEVQLTQALSEENRQLLTKALHKSGLELMQDKKAMLIEKVINIIVEMVHYTEDLPDVNFSTFLSEKMHMDYRSLSDLFSKTKGVTIEHFILLHKIERVKELIMYDELSLTEISYKMHYSSVAHLSNQFKSITGLSPSFFKKLTVNTRINLEDI
jgi:AraC-like DNA-binding protein